MSDSKRHAPPADEHWTRPLLPRPLEDAVRSNDARSLMQSAWRWHEALSGVAGSDGGGAGARLLDALPMEAHLAFEKITAVHPSLKDELMVQVEGAERLSGKLRFGDAAELDAFVRMWTGAHARVIAGIAGIGGYSWQERLLDESSRGFFLTAALMTIREDLGADRLLFPLTDAATTSLTLDDMFEGRVTEPVRRFLWRQVVRARDSFAQSQRIVDDLDRHAAASFRRWWFASLEILAQIEKHGFDIWQHPPRLSRYRRAHVLFQARFGQTTFR